MAAILEAHGRRDDELGVKRATLYKTLSEAEGAA